MRRPERTVATVVLCTTVFLAAGHAVAESAPACIPPERRAAITRCPDDSVRIEARPAVPLSGAGLRGRRSARPGESADAPASLWGGLSCESARAEARRSGPERLASSERGCLVRARVAHCRILDSRPSEGLLLLANETIEGMHSFLAQDHSADMERRCRAATARVVLDGATRWHRESVGTDVRPGTLDEGTMALALVAYRLALDAFPDLDEVGATGWPVDRVPTRPLVSYWSAELLWRMEQWDECGPAFTAAWSIDPRGDHAEDALYAAVLCANNHFMASRDRNEESARSRRRRPSPGSDDESSGDAARDRRRPLRDDERRVTETYRRFLCHVPESEDWAAVAYRRARLYLAANQFEEAAVLFDEVVRRAPSNEISTFAATLSLDSLQMIARTEPDRRSGCRAATLEHLERYLADDDLRRDEGFVASLSAIRCSLELDRARALVDAGRIDEALVIWTAIAGELDGRCSQSPGEATGLALHRAAVALARSGRAGPALRLWRVLLQQQDHLAEEVDEPPPSWVSAAMLGSGRAWRLLGDFGRARSTFDSLVTALPDSEHAPAALEESARLDLALGDLDAATGSLRRFEARARQQPLLLPRSLDLSLALARARSRDGHDEGAEKLLTGTLSTLHHVLRPEHSVRLRSAIGRARWARGAPHRESALESFRTVLEVYNEHSGDPFGLKLNGGAGVEPSVSSPTPKSGPFATSEARDAVAEAWFHLAEAQYDVLDDSSPWPRGDAAARAPARAVNDLFAKASRFGSTPWCLPATARMGDIAFALSEADLADFREATRHYSRCLHLAKTLRIQDSTSRHCARQLERISGRRFSRDDEFHALPSHAPRRLALPDLVTKLPVRLPSRPNSY